MTHNHMDLGALTSVDPFTFAITVALCSGNDKAAHALVDRCKHLGRVEPYARRAGLALSYGNYDEAHQSIVDWREQAATDAGEGFQSTDISKLKLWPRMESALRDRGIHTAGALDSVISTIDLPGFSKKSFDAAKRKLETLRESFRSKRR
jgi:DNA-directed RNA polymerase alpha subunit